MCVSKFLAYFLRFTNNYPGSGRDACSDLKTYSKLLLTKKYTADHASFNSVYNIFSTEKKCKQKATL